MNKTLVAVLGAGALLLAGCGSDDKADNNHAEACTNFASAQRELVGYGIDGKKALTLEQFTAAKTEAVESMDSAGLATTDSDIKARINSLVEGIPTDTTELLTSKSAAESFNTDSAAVSRACEAAGTTIVVSKIPIVKYMGP
ncbi:hypothetical protein EEB12_26655 [Rhodococcus sp. WS1]|uniref:hypothetical protein n=1 Tax=unclassified Rhodococcus (in: high G+C Gram-positive bacteria) TaxID=192944 RepID=UPI001144E58E|nr:MULTISPECIES: hypothetical protein [unclassified Rhodococcus (in: high G+C Gram-positive bacteria)]ROZ53511.1 hypothetical protein EEB12_26655 [Rhodococcus sp. WS1]TQC36781.1 hypothetical protein EEB16_16760 [Rhodococcus sp. WS7]